MVDAIEIDWLPTFFQSLPFADLYAVNVLPLRVSFT